MANETKDTKAAAAASSSTSPTTTPKKVVKTPAPLDPLATKNLIRLLNILALLLAILAFLLQLFAVVTHHWKWQVTGLGSVLSTHDKQGHAHDTNSRLEQHYGLYSRNVKIYANNDEQVDVWTSTRFPRLDDGEEKLHNCLTRSTTLRGALLTCAERINSPPECHCRRYFHWNLIIVLEIVALILLGVVIVISAIVAANFQPQLKLAGTALAFVAFVLMLIGLIVIIGYLKRETRSLADTYPHTYHQLARGVAGTHQRHTTLLRKTVRREAHETYRAYSLSHGQHPHNETHFQQYSEEANAWIYIPYSSLGSADPAPRSKQGQITTAASTTAQTTSGTQLYNKYGPVVGYDTVYAHTHAYLGWSTILSIIAMSLALLTPLILVFSWLQDKKLAGYLPVPLDASAVKEVQAKPVPSEYDSRRPINEALVITHNPGQGPPAPIAPAPVVAKTIPTTYDPHRPINEALVITHNVREGPPAPTVSSASTVPPPTVTKTIPTSYDPHRPINEALVTTHNVQQGPSEPAAAAKSTPTDADTRRKTPDSAVKSNPFTTTSSPTITTPSPNVKTPTPDVTKSTAAATTATPDVTKSNAAATTATPDVTKSNAAVTTPTPDVTKSNAAVTTPTPDVTKSNAAGTTSTPDVTTASPTATTPSPAVPTPSPTDTTSTPAVPTASPTATTPSAAATTPSPTDTTSTPTATTASPTDATPSAAATTSNSDATAPNTQQEPPQNNSGGLPDSGAAHHDSPATTTTAPSTNST